MQLQRLLFGRTSEGSEVELFALESEEGYRAELILLELPSNPSVCRIKRER